MRQLICSLSLILVSLVMSCQRQPNRKGEPAVQLLTLPPYGDGSPDKLHAIKGRVQGALPGEKVVLFARSGIWWVQPTAAEPFTDVDNDWHWQNMTHPGSAYAAMLVKPGYHAPATMQALPGKGGDILAVAVAEGALLERPKAKALRFSGYEWQMREAASDRGGTRNLYDTANAWTDAKGFLHLRIAKRQNDWTSAEVSLIRGMGYGLYRWVVQDVGQLEPGAVFSTFTWDDAGPPREMDIEISRWGGDTKKNAQFVIQPYYVPANVVRFHVPQGPLTFLLNWEPGRATFRALRGRDRDGPIVDEHTFSSGVPLPGNETIHINLYRFDTKGKPLERECEVVIERFEYLP